LAFWVFKPNHLSIDKAQTIDLSLKLVTELAAFAKLTAFPEHSIGIALADYSGESS